MGASPIADQSNARSPLSFHLGFAVLMSVLVVAGFWPTYLWPLFSGGDIPGSPLLHVHAAVFFGWMAILIRQTWLVARRRSREHIDRGPWGFAWAGAVFLLGMAVSIALMQRLLGDGDVAGLPGALWGASAPLVDITQFAILIILGWRSRKRRDRHKRYMALATVAIMPAATARMGYLLGPWSMELVFALVVAALIAYDFKDTQRVHPATVIGVLILLPRALLNVSYKFIG
jgi:hypothetical protein